MGIPSDSPSLLCSLMLLHYFRPVRWVRIVIQDYISQYLEWYRLDLLRVRSIQSFARHQTMSKVGHDRPFTTICRQSFVVWWLIHLLHFQVSDMYRGPVLGSFTLFNNDDEDQWHYFVLCQVAPIHVPATVPSLLVHARMLSVCACSDRDFTLERCTECSRLAGAYKAWEGRLSINPF